MARRLLPVAVALLFVTSGCVGLVTGETVSFEASPASVGDDALASTEYELARSDEQNITQNVSVFGQQRTIRLTNHVTEYSRAIELGPLGDIELARITVFSTPGATVAGQQLNPAAQWSNRRLIREIVSRSGGMSDVQRQENRTVGILGEPRDVGVFTGTTTVQGQEIDVRIHAASFEHDGDVIIAVAVHPTRIDERANVDTMFGGIQHTGT